MKFSEHLKKWFTSNIPFKILALLLAFACAVIVSAI